jgi:glycosyltransferase involved in cell wall biosynthesis
MSKKGVSSVAEDPGLGTLSAGSESRPLHILISAYACDPGRGSEPGVGWSWISGLSALCRVSAITRSSNRRAIEARLEREPLLGVRFYYQDLPSAFRVLKMNLVGEYLYYVFWQYLAYLLARRIHSADPFDLVHHVTYSSLPAPVFMQRLPVPFIFGPVAGGETMPLAFWPGGGVASLVYECLRAVWQATVRWDPIVQSAFHRAARILVATPETTQLVPSQYRQKVASMTTSGVKPSTAAASRNFLRVPEVHSDAESSTSCQIFMAGRLLHWKGFHLGVRAFARVACRYPGATLRIIGGGPQRIRLERLVVAEGLEDRVSFVPWLPFEEFLQLVDESDLLLYPALHCSGPTVVLHAMAAAKPVVCVDRGGPAVMVTAECGFKIPARTPDQVVGDLSNALARMLADASLRRQMGAAARQRAIDVYDWEKRVAEMYGLYKQVVARS